MSQLLCEWKWARVVVGAFKVILLLQRLSRNRKNQDNRLSR